jgi:cytochrome o ubiquinol oxidase operon protein cyoD
MSEELSLKEIQKEWHGTFRSYAMGFIGSLLLTLISFFLVATKLFTTHVTFYIIIGLALLQAAIQMIFFLHVGQEAKPRWETLVFYFMVMVVLIIGLGSLWIMFDLNERVMSHMAKEMPHD